MSFVDEALLVELLKDPPDALHELRVHRAVVIIHIHPASHALDDFSPLFRVALDGSSAEIIEFAHTELLDVLLTRQLFFFLDQVLDRQTVTVPSESALHVLPAHGLVARDDVFDRPCEQMSVVGEASRKRWSIVEAEDFTVFSTLERTLEDVFFSPVLEYPSL